MRKAERELGEQSKETATMLSCTAAWMDGGTVRVVSELLIRASYHTHRLCRGICRRA